MELYGSKYQESDFQLELGVERGLYFKDAVDALKAKKAGVSRDEYLASKNFIEGIRPSAEGDQLPNDLIDFVFKYDLDGDGIPEKYMGVFAPEHEVVLSVE